MGVLEDLGTGFDAILSPLETLFGSTNVQKQKSLAVTDREATQTVTGETRDRLEISDEAIDKIVSDILSGPEGLAAIFAGEKNAGIFNSSVSADAAGDLTSKIVGEIAKLRAERIQTENRKQVTVERSTQEAETRGEDSKKGLIGQIFG